MSEIKFRGKRVDNGEWAYGYYVMNYFSPRLFESHQEFEYYIYKGAFDAVKNAVKYEVIPETVGQYTGLKDKNGLTEVYEGDILSIENPGCQIQKATTLGLVAFNYCAWYLVNLESIVWQKYRVPAPTKRDSMLFATMIGCKEIEVIGNIHENPELLESK